MGPGCPGTTACHPSRGSTVGRGVAPTYRLRASACPPPTPALFLPSPPSSPDFSAACPWPSCYPLCLAPSFHLKHACFSFITLLLPLPIRSLSLPFSLPFFSVP